MEESWLYSIDCLGPLLFYISGKKKNPGSLREKSFFGVLTILHGFIEVRLHGMSVKR
jgi:hypothetical protein